MTNPEGSMSVAIAGIAGRMGRQLAAVSMDRGIKVTGGTEVAAANAYGEDIGILAGRRAIGLHPVEDAAAAASGAAVSGGSSAAPASSASGQASILKGEALTDASKRLMAFLCLFS